MFVKVEAFNPAGSVKSRLALAIIEDAEKKGLLKPGQTVIEATSGNTGISLAMVCAVKGYPFVAVMADSFSVERRKLIKAYGAKVILTPGAERGTGMVKKALELANQHGYYYCQQFDNEANPIYHSNTTAPEILDAFRSKNLDFFVTGYGTGGTFTGVARVLRVARPDCKLVLAEPDVAPMVEKGTFAPHPIQGWTPDFLPGTLDKTLYDELCPVSGADAIAYAKLLASKEGIFCGISSGGTFAAALKVAEKAPKGSNVLCVLPDTGERYLSTLLFKDITELSDEI
jgi:cysteine synthase A